MPGPSQGLKIQVETNNISPHCAGTQQQVVVVPSLACKTYEVNIIREFPIKYGFTIEATIMNYNN